MGDSMTVFERMRSRVVIWAVYRRSLFREVVVSYVVLTDLSTAISSFCVRLTDSLSSGG